MSRQLRRIGNLLETIAKAVAAIVLLMTFVVTGSQSVQAQPSALIYEGFTEASQDILVSGSELGRLHKVKVRMGDVVEKGQVLAQMDDVQQLAAVRLSQAQSEMTGDLDLAIAEERMNFDRLEKIRELAKRNMARPDEVSRQESQWEMASARVTQAREQQRLRQIQLERDQIQVERRRIIAPISGVIARVLHSEGEYITPADSAIFQLLHVDTLDGIFNIPAKEMTHVRTGKSVRVFLRSCSTTVDGVIDRISPSIEGKSGTVQVRVRIENPDREYLHGDRCTLRLELNGDDGDTTKRSAFALPDISSRQTVPAQVSPKPLVDASSTLRTKSSIEVIRPKPRVLVKGNSQPSADRPSPPAVTNAPREPKFGLPTTPLAGDRKKPTPARTSKSTLRLQPRQPMVEPARESPKTTSTAVKPTPVAKRDSISRAWLQDSGTKSNAR